MATAPKRLYVTATRRADGKTAVTLGLVLALKKRTSRIGFMKPLGKRDIDARGFGLDEDSVLVEKVCEIHCSIQDMSPVTIDREFSEEFFRQVSEAPENLMGRVKEAYRRIADEKDVVVLEGTGHACLGAVFGLANAQVARELAAKVLLVSSGGIGQPLDEIALNLAFFRSHGVEVPGVVINRVLPNEMHVLKDFGRRALERMGVRLFGLIPHHPVLPSKSVLQVCEGIGAELLNGSTKLSTRVGKTLVGAMTAHNAIERFEEDALLITGGDRTDLILAALASRLVGDGTGRGLAGLILTRNLRPPEAVMKLVKRTDLPVAIVETNTYDTATRIDQLEAKIAPNDRLKIETIRGLIEQHVDVDAIWEAL